MTSKPSTTGAPADTSITAEAYLALLKSRGIDILYVGAGTDTAPIVEAYARSGVTGLSFPKPVVITHENVAVGMAHGYYMVSGRPQAVMLHVSVGAANAVCGLMNAARAQVPIFFTAGRTPLFEHGRLGARDSSIHWAQEAFDQAGMVREFVKWDYELRDGCNLADVVDRALAIAMSHPRGPIYLTLPREVLAQPCEVTTVGTPALAQPPAPDPQALSRLAERLIAARFPLIVSTASGADPSTVPLLEALSDRFGIAVGEIKPRHVNFPSSHELHAGFEQRDFFQAADALLFLECDVPWLPAGPRPAEGAFICHAGTDPLFERYPLRSFRSDLTITAQTRTLLEELLLALEAAGGKAGASERHSRSSEFCRRIKASVAARRDAESNASGPISKAYLTQCLDEVLDDQTIIVNEYSAVRERLTLDRPGSFFFNPPSAGLGWGLPAALGAKQASPEKTVIAVVGDGAYAFANPGSCHHASAMHHLPVLTVVFNNGGWDAVQKSATMVYPGKHAAAYQAQHGMAPLSSLAPVPAFEKYSEASGGYGERVESRADLASAIRRALHAVTREGRQALLNVIGA